MSPPGPRPDVSRAPSRSPVGRTAPVGVLTRGPGVFLDGAPRRDSEHPTGVERPGVVETLPSRVGSRDWGLPGVLLLRLEATPETTKRPSRPSLALSRPLAAMDFNGHGDGSIPHTE